MPVPNMKDPKFKGTRAYNFTFKRLVNGIGSESENVTAAINADTGEVMNFLQSVVRHRLPEHNTGGAASCKSKGSLFSRNITWNCAIPCRTNIFTLML